MRGALGDGQPTLAERPRAAQSKAHCWASIVRLSNVSTVRRPAPAPDRLLAAARLAFARDGFQGASTHAIAKAAGVPQGLVRHHFGSKEGLWCAVVERGLAEVRVELEALPSGLTVAAWTAIVDQHLALAAVLLHALLEGGAHAEHAAEHAAPVLAHLQELQRSAQPYADGALLPMWLLASVAVPLLRRAGAQQPWVARSQEIDRLFGWLCGGGVPQTPGPFAMHGARSRLRGAS
jgi:AcrR family transcriptional regulator